MQPCNNNGSINIRFNRFNYAYKLSKLGNFHEKAAYAEAVRICIAIENDLSMGRFTCANNEELFKAYHPLARLSSEHEVNNLAIDAITLIENHIAKRELKERILLPCLTLLRTYGKAVKTKDDAQKFWLWMSNDGNRSNNSNNLYLATLKPVCPMFKGIKPLKASKVMKQEKPFTKEEIKQILKAVNEHHSYYENFIKFLFATGCRTSEAIALTWDCVDFGAKTITIKDSVGIGADGSKVRKETKTGVTRVIPMSEGLGKVLNSMRSNILRGFNQSLVFPTPNGQFIDLGNFRTRVWVKALQAASVPYRTIYNTRHTFISHFLNETPDFVKCASITHGTKSGIQTLMKHYAHIVDSVVMPDMFGDL